MDENKRSLSTQQIRLKRLFSNKAPSAYFPQLILIFKYQLGLTLSQLAYWEGKQLSRDGWIYKTEKEMRRETGLSAANQKYAIKHGLELEILEMTYRQVPRKRHYRVNWQSVYEILEFEAPKHGLKLSFKPMEWVDNKPTNTETTQKKTTKTSSSPNSIGNILKKRFFGDHHGGR